MTGVDMTYSMVRSLIYILLVFGCTNSTAQKLNFKHLTVDEGLSQNTVLAIAQDSSGYMWFGTQNGLNRYNGYEFEIFEANNSDSLSLSSSFINALEVDGNDNLWIGTNKGLTLWNQRLSRFKRMDNMFVDDSLKGQYDFWDILIDHDGAVWVMGESKGFHIFKKNKNESFFHKVLSIPQPATNIVSDLFGQLMEDHAGNIWIGTSKSGLWVYKKSFNTFHEIELPNPNDFSVTAITEDNQHSIWIGSSRHGLFKLVNESSKLQLVTGLNDSAIRSLYRDRESKIWVGTDKGGLNLYNTESNTFSYYDNENGNSKSLLHNSVWCIFQDKQNILWVGTYSGGVNYYDPHAGSFELYQAGVTPYNLTNNTVTGFAEDSNGYVWIGTDRGGVNLFNPKSKSFKSFKHEKTKSKSITSDVVQHIYNDKSNRLWVATWLGGLEFYDKEKNTFNHFLHDPTIASSISSNTVNYVTEDHDRNLWIGTLLGVDFADSKQLTGHIPPSLIFKHYQNQKSDKTSLSTNYIKTIYEDRSGKIWIGTQKGINLFDRKKQQFIHFRNNPSNKKIFNTNFILCINENSAGQLLVGTNENGMLVYDQEHDILKTYNKQNGFPSNTVFGILEDEHHNLWISTNNGLFKFDVNTGSYIQYNKWDGLQSNEFKANAFIKLANGKLLFGGTNGFNAFHPDSIPLNYAPPKLSLTRFKLFNKVIAPGIESVLPEDISVLKEISLAHDQSFIGLEFTALNFTVPEKNEYAYKLLPLDDNWNDIGNQRSVNFSYLSPGSYTLLIKASNNDNVWSQPIELKITINSPWWQTAWFRFLFITSLIVLVWIWFTVRTKQLIRRKSELESTVRQRTAELQQSNKLLSERQEEIINQNEEIITQRDNLEKQYHTIQTLSEIGQKITSSLKRDDLIFRVYEMINQVVDAPIFSIGYISVPKSSIEFSTLTNYGDAIQEDSVSLQHTDRLSVKCIRSKKVILLNDIDSEVDNYVDEIARYKSKDAPKSSIYLPLFRNEDDITGVLIVKNFNKNSYTAVHINMLKTLAAYIGIAFDNASVYKEIEEQSRLLAKSSAQLKELDTLKTRFFINISHEFRTPLTLIVSPLEQMLASGHPDEWPKIFRQLQVMNKNAKQLLSLINELLELRNLDAGLVKINATYSNLNLIISEVMAQFESMASKYSITLTLYPQEEDVMLWLDKSMIEKILINLYSNAFKYTSQGGSINTSIENHYQDNSHYIKITVEDTGVGIPENELPYVFERFYQGIDPVNHLQASTGIGLSLVKDLVKLHHGKITVDSKLNEGTRFSILIPQKNHQLTTVMEPNNANYGLDQQSEQGNGINGEPKELPVILIVEDNEDVREFLRVSLEGSFRLLEAENGRDGLTCAKKDIPDLIVSDVMMPVMDGIELCKQTKSTPITSHIPVILLTAKSGEESQIQGLNIGADDYIAKPFSIKILEARINNLIASRRKLHTLFSAKNSLNVNEIITNVHDQTFLEKIDKVVKENVKDFNLNHELLSKEAGMSKTQLYRKLQALTGQTVHEYIRNYRLKLAYDIIREKPEMLIFEVAYELGFKDHAYFSKLFHSHFGLWPKDVKKDMSNNKMAS